MNVKDANALCKRWHTRRWRRRWPKKEKEGDFRVVEEMALVPLAEAIAGIEIIRWRQNGKI